ncbi:hypothetical protein [Variovorax paradoxus]|uniref:hypothetical protein n=1 Tax=Variovorax paradoxus TaxID=34073 RepID=UPI003D64C956
MFEGAIMKIFGTVIFCGLVGLSFFGFGEELGRDSLWAKACLLLHSAALIATAAMIWKRVRSRAWSLSPDFRGPVFAVAVLAVLLCVLPATLFVLGLWRGQVQVGQSGLGLFVIGLASLLALPFVASVLLLSINWHSLRELRVRPAAN